MQGTRRRARTDHRDMARAVAKEEAAHVLNRRALRLAAQEGAGIGVGEAFQDIRQTVAAKVKAAPSAALIGDASGTLGLSGDLCGKIFVGF